MPYFSASDKFVGFAQSYRSVTLHCSRYEETEQSSFRWGTIRVITSRTGRVQELEISCEPLGGTQKLQAAPTVFETDLPLLFTGEGPSTAWLDPTLRQLVIGSVDDTGSWLQSPDSELFLNIDANRSLLGLVVTNIELDFNGEKETVWLKNFAKEIE